MKKYKAARQLRPTATQPGPLPQNHVLTMTAMAKKNQKGFPKGACSARDSHNAIDTSAMASAYRHKIPDLDGAAWVVCISKCESEPNATFILRALIALPLLRRTAFSLLADDGALGRFVRPSAPSVN